MSTNYGNLVTCVNRSCQPIEGTFDGQIIVMPAGYVDAGNGKIVRAVDGNGAPVVTLLPSNVAAIVKSQNPVMGTQDPSETRPDEYLMGVEKWPTGTKDDTSHIEQSDSIELIDRSALGPDRAGAVTIKGKGRRSRAGVAVKTRTVMDSKPDYED